MKRTLYTIFGVAIAGLCIITCLIYMGHWRVNNADKVRRAIEALERHEMYPIRELKNGLVVFHWEYKLIELGDEAVDPLFEEWLLGPRYIKKQAPKHIRHDCIDSLILIGTRRAMDIISDIYTKGSENDRRFILEMLTGRGRYVTLDMDNKFIDTITDPSLISDGICEELVSALVSLIGFRFELPPDDAPDKINTFQKGIGAWRNEYLRRIRWSKTHNRYIINIPILDYIKTPN